MAHGKSLLVCCFLAVVLAVLVHTGCDAAATSSEGRVALGGSCSNNTNCTTPHSVCRSNRCACADGYEVNGTTCTIKLHSPCNSTHLCNRTGAMCRSGYCECMTGYAEYQANCLKMASRPYEACSQNFQCGNLANTQCYNGVCACDSGYFYSQGSSRCEQRSCTQNSCSSYGLATCSSGMCYCNQGAIVYQDYCYRRVIGTVGDACDSMDLCYLAADGANQNIDCVSKKCTCRKNYKPDKSKKSCVSGAPAAVASFIPIFLAVLISVGRHL